MQKLFVLAAILAGVANAQSPLTTTYANNNSGSVGGAIYFDLTAAVALTITGIDVNLNTAASTPGSIDIYTCPTTYLGNEANAAAWTMIGTGTVVSNGPGTATSLTLAAPFVINAGTNGYAYAGISQAFSYTNGNGSNQSYSTAELTLNAGAAVNAAFSGTPFTPRVVNTSIHYAPAVGFATKTAFGTGCNAPTPLTLNASARPVLGTTISLDTTNIPAASPLGAMLYGLLDFPNGLSLSGIGMPGCHQYITGDANQVFVPSGPSAGVNYILPNDPSYSGVTIFTQAAVLAPGANTLGFLSSNGLRLLLGVN